MTTDMIRTARVVVVTRRADLAGPVRDALARDGDLDIQVAHDVDDLSRGEAPPVAVVAGGDDAAWTVDACRRLATDPRQAGTLVIVVAAVEPAAALAAGAVHVVPPGGAAEAAAWAAALARATTRGEPLLGRAFARCPAGLALLDADLRCVRVNDALVELSALAPGQHRGRTLDEVLRRADLDAVHTAAREVLRDGRAREGLPVSGWSPRTSGMVWHGVVDLFAVEHGEVAFGLLLRDVTAERVAHAELSATLERERAARAEVEAYQERLAFVHIATGALYSTALDAALRARTLARLVVPSLADWCLVYARPRVEGETWRAAAHWDPDRQAQADALSASDDTPAWAAGPLDGGEPELVATPEDATPSDPDLVQALGLRSYAVVPLRAGRGPFGALLFGFAESSRRYTPRDVELLQDLAQRASIALENAELYRETELALRARDQLISIATHDVRNPLGAALLRLALMRTAVDRGDLQPDKLGDGVRRAEQALKDAVALLNDLLNVTRIASGRIELKLEKVDLRALTLEVIERSRELLQAAGCRVVAPPPGPTIVGRWDRIRLEQVVANLLSNASKYGRGKPIEVRLDVQGGRAHLAVQDHGVGIPPADQERIFERFARTWEGNRHDSHGLGLWIIKRVVTALGGRVWIESAPGAGATFHVELPTEPAAEDASLAVEP
ncbi:MAG: ATP-binding protein [Planctomycetes bacterium]|nr:ATP-binding protein [Planctomycetota bacterium]